MEKGFIPPRCWRNSWIDASGDGQKSPNFPFQCSTTKSRFFCNSQEDANGMDEAETWHTQTPLPITPTSQPLPRGSNTQDGLGSNVTESGTFSGKMWESSLSPSPSGLWPRNAPLCREQPEPARPEQRLFVSLGALGQPRSSSEPSSGCRGNGRRGRDGRHGRETWRGKILLLPKEDGQDGSDATDPAPSSPSIQHPSPGHRDARGGLGMLQLLPALPSKLQGCIPCLNPWL